MKNLLTFLFLRRHWIIILFLSLYILFNSITVTYISNEVPGTDKMQAHYFYYNQLSTVEKEIYNVLSNSKYDFIYNNDILCISAPYDMQDQYLEYIYRAIDAYTYDNPESSIYFYKYKYTVSIFLNASNSNQYDYILQPNCKGNRYSYFSPEEIQDMLEIVESTTKEFVKTLSGSDTEKLTMIYDWLLKNAVYDTSSLPNSTNIYAAIIDKNAVCTGYALAFKYVSDMAGLDSIYVNGYLDEKGESLYHSWNLAYSKNEWLFLDITSDLASSTNQHQFCLLSKKKKEKMFKLFGFTYSYEDKNFIYPL